MTQTYLVDEGLEALIQLQSLGEFCQIPVPLLRILGIPLMHQLERPSCLPAVACRLQQLNMAVLQQIQQRLVTADHVFGQAASHVGWEHGL